MAREGHLILPAADEAVEFAPLVVRSEGNGVAEAGGARAWEWFWRGLRSGSTPGRRLAEIVSALSAVSDRYETDCGRPSIRARWRGRYSG